MTLNGSKLALLHPFLPAIGEAEKKPDLVKLALPPRKFSLRDSNSVPRWIFINFQVQKSGYNLETFSHLRKTENSRTTQFTFKVAILVP